MVVSAKISVRKVQQRIADMQERSRRSVGVREAMLFVAEQIIGEARNRAPIRFGELKNSDFVNESTGFGNSLSVTMGFAARHATVMDQGWDVSIIRPVRAKALFIPLSRRAARLGASGDGNLSQLLKTRGSSLKRGVDYVFAKSVRTKKAVKGRREGPNFFFSGTVEDFVAERSPSLVLTGIARGVTAMLSGARRVAEFESERFSRIGD